jgi:selenocysteine-specific elongation factor
VVTGYVVSGSVRADDALVLAPRANKVGVRVRGLRALNRAVEQGVAGQRCALNLVGVERSEVARGDWVVDAASHLASERWDVRLQLLPSESKPLRTGANVHVHVGAWHGMARVVTLEGNSIEPGQSALAQLVLDRPASAWHGDRLILRDASAQRTLGGGQIIDPLGPARYRRTPERLAQLAALEIPDAVQSLTALAAVSPLGVDVARFQRSRDRHPLPANIHLPGLRRLQAEGVDVAFTDAQWQQLSERVLSETARFHDTHPEDIGLDGGRLKRQAFPKLADSALTALVAGLCAEGKLARQGVWLQLPVHAEQLGAQDQRLAQRVLPLLVDGRFDPPWVRDIAKAIDTPESLVRAVMNRMARRGETFQIVKDLHYAPAVIREGAQLAERLQTEHGAIRAAEFRDGTGLGRKRAIQILEYFDRIGFTRRLGDDHVIRSRALLLQDDAAP